MNSKPEPPQLIPDDDQDHDHSITRRQFLKIAGVTLAGVAATLLPGLPTRMAALDALQDVPIEAIHKALELARQEPMFQEAIAELDNLDIQFNIIPEAVGISSVQGDLVGLVLHQSGSPSRRMGASLILTVDLSKEVLNNVQYLLGWCLVQALKLKSVNFHIRLQPYEEARDDRVHDVTLPRMIRPRIEHHWSFPRLNSPPIRLEDLVEFGWPPETAMSHMSHYWYFDGCTSPGWTVYREAKLFRCAQVGEHQSDDARQGRYLDLDYIDR